MHPSLLKEIPEFLHDSIVYCDNLTHKKNERSCFVLTKNLKFYVFRKKQLLHSIDLSSTSFAKLKQKIMMYDDRNCEWFADVADQTAMQEKYLNTKTSKITSQQSLSKNEIKFGKYIYTNFDERLLYLLLKCWDTLVVLQRSTDTTASNLRFIAEYENVMNFKVVPSTMIKFQAVVKLQFGDGKFICMDFQEHENSDKSSNVANLQHQRSEFKQILERVRHTKAELQFHKEITQKHFQNLKNKQTFGSNFLRIAKLDEKPMLSRCGDVWTRITSAHELVIGLPLVNNCTPANSTILKNLQPILNTHSSDTIPTGGRGMSNSINYEYRIYQLQQTFENLETLETFFQSEDAQFELNTWTVTDAHILPTAYVVLLLKIQLSQIMLIDEICQLFVRFHIEKDLQMTESKTHTFEQHLFIKNIDFQKILLRRQENEINFNKKTIHQDFLALAMTGFSTKFQIYFATDVDRSKFEQLLVLKFDFEMVHREEVKGFNDNASMEVDNDTNEHKRFPCTLFYNRKPSSLWFGALIMRASDCETFDNCDEFQSTWTFYNKNEDTAFLMCKLLFTELIAVKCNVIDIKYGEKCQLNDSKVAKFNNALRQELAVFLNIANNKYNGDELIENLKLLNQLQYNTDILVAAQCHNIN